MGASGAECVWQNSLHHEAARYPVPFQVQLQVPLYGQLDDLVADAALEYHAVRALRHGDPQGLAVVDPVFVPVVDDDLDRGIDREPLALPGKGHGEGLRLRLGLRARLRGRRVHGMPASGAEGCAGDQLTATLVAKHGLTPLKLICDRTDGVGRRSERPDDPDDAADDHGHAEYEQCDVGELLHGCYLLAFRVFVVHWTRASGKRFHEKSKLWRKWPGARTAGKRGGNPFLRLPSGERPHTANINDIFPPFSLQSKAGNVII